MGKGSPIIGVRISPLFLAAIESAIKGKKNRRTKQPMTKSDFVLAAISEKLAHEQRSKKSAAKRRAKTDSPYAGPWDENGKLSS